MRWGLAMVDVTSPSIFSAADETIARLDGLNLAERNRTQRGLRDLEAAVARLDQASGVDQPGEPEQAPRERRNERDVRSDPTPDPLPFVALPQRTTHGGPWGPAMRERLTAEALGKRGW